MLLPTPLKVLPPTTPPASLRSGIRTATQLYRSQTLLRSPSRPTASDRPYVVLTERHGLQLHILTLRLYVVPVITVLTVLRLTTLSPPLSTLYFVNRPPRPLVSPLTRLPLPLRVIYLTFFMTLSDVRSTFVSISLPMLPVPVLGAPNIIIFPLVHLPIGTPPMFVFVCVIV